MSKKAMVVSILTLSVIALGVVLYGVMTETEAGLKTPTSSWPLKDLPLSVKASAYSGTHPDHKAANAVTKSVVDSITMN